MLLHYYHQVCALANKTFTTVLDERGEGPINYIALIAGVALIAAAVLAAFAALSPSVGAAISTVVQRALAAAGGG